MPNRPVRSPVRKHYVVAGVLAAVLMAATVVAAALAGLRSGNDQATTQQATTQQATEQASTSRPTTPVSEPPLPEDDNSLGMLPSPPAEGACRLLTPAALTEAVDDSSRSSCQERHTARTIAVRALDGHVLDDSDINAAAVADQADTQCDRAFAAYVGGSPEDRRLSRLQPVWFTADERAIAAGALWVRCDVVAYETDAKLAALPSALAGVLDGNGGTQLGLCSTKAPQAERARNVTCSRQHTWRALSVIPLGDGPWPGVNSVRTKGDGTCSAQARTAQGSPDQWRYGWQWPTKAQWQAGRGFGYCWVPDA